MPYHPDPIHNAALQPTTDVVARALVTEKSFSAFIEEECKRHLAVMGVNINITLNDRALLAHRLMQMSAVTFISKLEKEKK